MLCYTMIQQVKSVGQVLFNDVVQKLGVLETDYFDLQYTNAHNVNVSTTTLYVQFMYSSYAVQERPNWILCHVILNSCYIFHDTSYFTRVADVPSWQRLAVPPFNLSTVGERAFRVSAPASGTVFQSITCEFCTVADSVLKRSSFATYGPGHLMVTALFSCRPCDNCCYLVFYSALKIPTMMMMMLCKVFLLDLQCNGLLYLSADSWCWGPFSTCSM